MTWSPDEWQHRIVYLAQRYHVQNGGHQFQKIPDHHGDCGLEGFSTDGHSYQCYVPEEDGKTPLIDRIIKKLNDDTLKIKNRKDELAKMLGTIQLRFWHLVIPPEAFRDKKFVERSGVRSSEVIGWGLPFIDPDFRIIVSDGGQFDKDADELRRLMMPSLVVDSTESLLEEIPTWEDNNNENVSAIDRKLKSTKKTPSAIKVVRDELFKCAVAGQNSLARFRESSPEAYELIVKAKQEKARSIRVESAMSSMLASELLLKTINDFKTELKQALPGLDEAGATILANEAVTDWLASCALDFYGSP